MQLSPQEYAQYQELWKLTNLSPDQSKEWSRLFHKLYYCHNNHVMSWDNAKNYPEQACWKCNSDTSIAETDLLLEILEAKLSEKERKLQEEKKLNEEK